jgi:DNA primase
MAERKKLRLLADILGSNYQSGEEYLFYCPKCKHHKRKLSVNIQKDAYKCWICDWSGKSVYRLVKRYGSFTQRNEWASLSDKLDLTTLSDDLFEKKEKIVVEQEVNLPKNFLTLASYKTIPASLPARAYLEKRGISREDMINWKIGFCQQGEYVNRIIVPSFGMRGKCNYFVGRSYTGDFRKYMNPSASKDIIFNELFIEWDKEITLVEGVFDAIKAGRNAIPVLGSTVRPASQLFKKIVEHETPVAVAFDEDAEKKSMRLIKNLMSYGVEVRKVDIAPYSDVGEMPRGEFLDRKNNAEFMNHTDYLLRMISNV